MLYLVSTNAPYKGICYSLSYLSSSHRSYPMGLVTLQTKTCSNKLMQPLMHFLCSAANRGNGRKLNTQCFLQVTNQKDNKSARFFSSSSTFPPHGTISSCTDGFGGNVLAQAGDLLWVGFFFHGISRRTGITKMKPGSQFGSSELICS